MASIKQQKKAALAKSRERLMDLVFDAKMKRANEVRVIKDFASVVTFLDHEDDLPVMDKPIANKQVDVQTKAQPTDVVPPTVKTVVEKRTQIVAKSSSQPTVDEKAVEEVGSDYWERKYK